VDKKKLTANPEFVKACMNLFSQLMRGEITKAHYDEGCEMLADASEQFEVEKRKPTPDYRALAFKEN
jgi:hypothetical protein